MPLVNQLIICIQYAGLFWVSPPSARYPSTTVAIYSLVVCCSRSASFLLMSGRKRSAPDRLSSVVPPVKKKVADAKTTALAKASASGGAQLGKPSKRGIAYPSKGRFLTRAAPAQKQDPSINTSKGKTPATKVVSQKVAAKIPAVVPGGAVLSPPPRGSQWSPVLPLLAVEPDGQRTSPRPRALLWTSSRPSIEEQSRTSDSVVQNTHFHYGFNASKASYKISGTPFELLNGALGRICFDLEVDALR